MTTLSEDLRKHAAQNWITAKTASLLIKAADALDKRKPPEFPSKDVSAFVDGVVYFGLPEGEVGQKLPTIRT